MQIKWLNSISNSMGAGGCGGGGWVLSLSKLSLIQ